MLRRICALLSLGAALMLTAHSRQIPGQPQIPGRSPGGNTPTVPDPNEPETKSPKKHQSSSKEVTEKLQKALDNKNAAYRGSNIQTSVDDQNIILTGSVTSSMQHDMALQLVRAYGEDRTIVDKLVIQP
jgi:BON domain